MDADHAEPVVEIFAELAFGHPLLEVRVGRGEHADVHRLWTRLADRHDLALLQESQQLRLDVERQVADFVEEQRASDRRSNQSLLIGDRAGEAAAAMPEQLAVGQLARGRRAVVGQEHRGASWRADMNRARDEVLAGTAFPGDQHGEVVTLKPLDLVGQAIHCRTGADEPGQERLERSLVVLIDGQTRSFARPAQIESLPRDRREHAHAAGDRVVERGIQCQRAASRPVLIRAECFDDQQFAVELRVTLASGVSQARRYTAVTSGSGDDAQVATAGFGEDHDRSTFSDFQEGSGGLAREKLFEDRRVHQSPDDALVGI